MRKTLRQGGAKDDGLKGGKGRTKESKCTGGRESAKRDYAVLNPGT